MAQPIYCDVEGCQNGADLLVTQIHTGSVQAMCNEHYAEFVFSMASQMIENDAAEGMGEQPGGEEPTPAKDDETQAKAEKEGKAENGQTPETAANE